MTESDLKALEALTTGYAEFDSRKSGLATALVRIQFSGSQHQPGPPGVDDPNPFGSPEWRVHLGRPHDQAWLEGTPRIPCPLEVHAPGILRALAH